MIRHILPAHAQPTTIISTASLHRAHLPPHDTIQALALPSPDTSSQAHGAETALEAINQPSDIPGGIGKSSPTGQILFSFALPDTEPSTRTPNGLTITTLNAVVSVTQTPKREWVLKVIPGKGTDVQPKEEAKGVDGVENELRDFVSAVNATREGKELDGKALAGYPTGPLWDVGFIQALLTSQGKPVELASL